MIDLTPLDVRNKRGDFKRLMRGYDPQEVDVFLELAAERLEALTRENIALRERAQTLQQQVDSQSDREQAVQEALVTAQELRADIRGQAQREAESILKEAQTEGRRLVAEAEAEARTKLRGSERRLDQLVDSMEEMERRRSRFIKEFRQLLERELDVVQVEEDRKPLEERAIDLDLGGKRAAAPEEVEASAPELVQSADPGGSPLSEASQLDAQALADEPSEAPVVQDAPPPAEVVDVDGMGEVPPLDAPIDELAAAFEQGEGSEATESPGSAREAPGHPSRPSTPDSRGRRHENLWLYLDPDEET